MPQSPSSSSSSEANLFRKKPVVVSAVQYTEAVRDAYLFNKAELPAGVYIPARTTNPLTRKVWSADAYIDTLEGRMSVSLGDWVITGVQGEHYPCTPDIFAATYEPASTATPPSLPIDFKQASEQGGWQWVPKEPTPGMMDAAWDHTPFNMEDMTDGDFGKAYQDMLAAAPQRSADLGGWLPIATAPKDGTSVLVWCSGDFIPSIAFNSNGRWCYSRGYVLHVTPTHWRPLPNPPSPHPEEGALLLGGDEGGKKGGGA